MKETRPAKGAFVVVLIGATMLHPMVHTETVHYVPTTSIVHNGGEVVTATASAMVIPGEMRPSKVEGSHEGSGSLTTRSRNGVNYSQLSLRPS